MAARTRSRLSRTAASGRPTVWKIVFFRNHAAIVHLDIDEIGIDSVDSRAVSFEKHGGRVEASVADDGGGRTGTRKQRIEMDSAV